MSPLSSTLVAGCSRAQWPQWGGPSSFDGATPTRADNTNHIFFYERKVSFRPRESVLAYTVPTRNFEEEEEQKVKKKKK
eukprot:6476387-Amphidinium_carterae.1